MMIERGSSQGTSPTSLISRRSATVLAVARSMTVGAVVCYTVTLPLIPRGGSLARWIDSWGLLAFAAFGSAVLLARSVLVRKERFSWLLIGLAYLLNCFGDVVWYLLDYPATASKADIFYLGFYPVMYVGLLLLVRQRTRDRAVAPWLDGLTLGLATAAVIGAFAFGSIVESAAASTISSRLVNLSYPIGDLILIVLMVASMSSARWRPDRAVGCIAVSILMYALADTLYLYQSASDSYAPGSIVDASWAGGLALSMAAAWLKIPDVKVTTRSPSHVSVMALLASAAATGVLILGAIRHIPLGATVAAGTALAVAIGRMVLTHSDLRSLAASRIEARTDDLTRLANRRSLNEALVASASADAQVTLLLLDLDGFKEVNDSLGHHAGDQLLGVIAERLCQTVGGNSLVARLGGDEFAVLLNTAEAAEGDTVARRIHESLQVPTHVQDLEIRIEASIGLAKSSGAAASSPYEAAAELLRCADVAMYAAKRSRSKTQWYLPEVDPNSRTQLQTMTEFRRALEREELVLYYQPKVSLAGGRISGFEALIRWEHPTRGLLLPDQFLPLVEAANLLPRITRFALRSALADACLWPHVGGRPLSISINVSPGDLLDESFAGLVQAMIAQSGMAPERVILEITEGTLINEPVRVERSITNLRNVGVRISLDDFGSGFSSLSHLAMLTIDELKLDRTIAADVVHHQNGQRSRAIVAATASLANALGVELVVEGIEDEETRQCLDDLGCDLAQGFYFSRPMPANEVVNWIEGWTSTCAVQSQLEPGRDSGFPPTGGGGLAIRPQPVRLWEPPVPLPPDAPLVSALPQ
jgi:diguanylate cyclase